MNRTLFLAMLTFVVLAAGCANKIEAPQVVTKRVEASNVVLEVTTPTVIQRRSTFEVKGVLTLFHQAQPVSQMEGSLMKNELSKKGQLYLVAALLVIILLRAYYLKEGLLGWRVAIASAPAIVWRGGGDIYSIKEYRSLRAGGHLLLYGSITSREIEAVRF